MGYYDSVKDSIKDQERGENSAKGGNFDTLKENAQENTKSDEEKGDDTPIEVVDQDGVSRQTPGKDRSSSRQKDSSGSNSSDQDGSGDNPFTSDGSGSADMSGVEEKLDKIIEQNQRMIEILESFGN
jgi:hypothetical protein